MAITALSQQAHSPAALASAFGATFWAGAALIGAALIPALLLPRPGRARSAAPPASQPERAAE